MYLDEPNKGTAFAIQDTKTKPDMAPEEPPASVPANIDDDIAVLAILAVQTNNGNLENLDWDEIAGRMHRERGLDVTAVDCR